MKTVRDQILKVAEKQGVFRPQDVRAPGNPGHQLARLVEEGVLIKVGRGLYSLTSREPVTHQGLTEAAAAVPRGIVCLISALDFHGFTSQQPYEHWLAVDHYRPVAVRGLPIRIIRMTGPSFKSGVEEHVIDGVRVRLFCAAKTVADCFRYRNRIGLDVALEALREGWRHKKFTMAELDRYAGVCRVTNVMRPYKEMLLG